MLTDSRAFSGFSSNDIDACRTFYADTLGLKVSDENGMLDLQLAGGGHVLIYPKDDHQPATYTCLNFPVADIDGSVDALTKRGVTFEHYEGFEQDEHGVMRGDGPPIAWFTDPAGNILSIIEESGPGGS
jgi:catechol 2,3-dioxygenase-like lactoylglutathione lyase family enzyme